MVNPVQQQFKAFNKRNLDAFLSAYAADIRVENGSGEEMMSSWQEFRGFYKNLFDSSPNLHCDIISRTQIGDWVIDEEKLEGLQAEGFPEEAHAMVAYKVSNGKITFVRMFS